jgi:hypothetical protein
VRPAGQRSRWRRRESNCLRRSLKIDFTSSWSAACLCWLAGWSSWLSSFSRTKLTGGALADRSLFMCLTCSTGSVLISEKREEENVRLLPGLLLSVCLMAGIALFRGWFPLRLPSRPNPEIENWQQQRSRYQSEGRDSWIRTWDNLKPAYFVKQRSLLHQK